MGHNYLNVKYKLNYGRQWVLDKAYQDTGISQAGCYNAVHSTDIVWNLPFDFRMLSKDVAGWPKLALEIWGPDLFGRSIILAYGLCNIPTETGFQERKVHLFKPKPISEFRGFIGSLFKMQPAFKNSEKILCTGEGRNVTRVDSMGCLNIKFQVSKRNTKKFGF